MRCGRPLGCGHPREAESSRAELSWDEAEAEAEAEVQARSCTAQSNLSALCAFSSAAFPLSVSSSAFLVAALILWGSVIQVTSGQYTTTAQHSAAQRTSHSSSYHRSPSPLAAPSLPRRCRRRARGAASSPSPSPSSSSPLRLPRHRGRCCCCLPPSPLFCFVHCSSAHLLSSPFPPSPPPSSSSLLPFPSPPPLLSSQWCHLLFSVDLSVYIGGVSAAGEENRKNKQKIKKTKTRKTHSPLHTPLPTPVLSLPQPSTPHTSWPPTP